jgi:hypothetical protein
MTLARVFEDRQGAGWNIVAAITHAKTPILAT